MDRRSRGETSSRRSLRPLVNSALGKLRDICGNCPGLARLILPCGGTPTAILYIHLGRLRIRSDDGRDIGIRKDIRLAQIRHEALVDAVSIQDDLAFGRLPEHFR